LVMDDLEKSAELFKKHIGKNIVVPGFYGVDDRGEIRTFPRGGSDITGAIVANIAGASVYENWTDVNGVFTKNPNFYSAARHHTELSYDDAEKMDVMVLHSDCIKYVKHANIPIVIKNTFYPDATGTKIHKKEKHK